MMGVISMMMMMMMMMMRGEKVDKIGWTLGGNSITQYQPMAKQKQFENRKQRKLPPCQISVGHALLKFDIDSEKGPC